MQQSANAVSADMASAAPKHVDSKHTSIIQAEKARLDQAVVNANTHINANAHINVYNNNDNSNSNNHNSGGRLCTLIGVPWRGVSFSTFSTG